MLACLSVCYSVFVLLSFWVVAGAPGFSQLEVYGLSAHFFQISRDAAAGTIRFLTIESSLRVQRLGKHMGTAASIENAVKGASPEEIKAALAALPKDHVACSRVPPCHAMPCHGSTCHAIFWRVMPCHILTCHGVS